MLADGALAALERGDGDLHDKLIADAARRVVDDGADVVALAQFTMARAAPAVEQVVHVPVLTTVASAVRALRAKLGSDTHFVRRSPK
jgi:aspartate/glutamate racemase